VFKKRTNDTLSPNTHHNQELYLTSYEVHWNPSFDYICSSEDICMYAEDQKFWSSEKIKQSIHWDMQVFGLMHLWCIWKYTCILRHQQEA